MKVVNTDRQIYCTEFYLCLYTRLRKQIFKSPRLYQAFLDEVNRILFESDGKLLGVTRGAENGKGKFKYPNAFLTLHIRTDRYNPEYLFEQIRERGWKAICEADAETHYQTNNNIITRDFLVLGANDYDRETIFEYAYTRDTRTQKDNQQNNGGNTGAPDRK